MASRRDKIGNNAVDVHVYDDDVAAAATGLLFEEDDDESVIVSSVTVAVSVLEMGRR